MPTSKSYIVGNGPNYDQATNKAYVYSYTEGTKDIRVAYLNIPNSAVGDKGYHNAPYLQAYDSKYGKGTYGYLINEGYSDYLGDSFDIQLMSQSIVQPESSTSFKAMAAVMVALTGYGTLKAIQCAKKSKARTTDGYVVNHHTEFDI